MLTRPGLLLPVWPTSARRGRNGFGGKDADGDDPPAGLPVAVGRGAAGVGAVPPPGRSGPGETGPALRAHP